MNYYKLINGTQFINIATTLDFRKFQKKHSIILTCDESQGQYVQCGEKLYRAYWLKPVTTDKFPYETVDIIAITEEEYNIFKKAVEANEEIIIEPDTPIEEDDIPADPIEETTIDYIKSAKINELSVACNKIITNGFDVTLSDEKTHHFSLTTQDQLNLLTLSTLIENGETEIPYHADGDMCKYYSQEDMISIINCANNFKTYHITYFNSLKAYVNSMQEMEEISKVKYGCLIPDEYRSEVLKGLDEV